MYLSMNFLWNSERIASLMNVDSFFLSSRPANRIRTLATLISLKAKLAQVRPLEPRNSKIGLSLKIYRNLKFELGPIFPELVIEIWIQHFFLLDNAHL